jgi:hypothetical protein
MRPTSTATGRAWLGEAPETKKPRACARVSCTSHARTRSGRPARLQTGGGGPAVQGRGDTQTRNFNRRAAARGCKRRDVMMGVGLRGWGRGARPRPPHTGAGQVRGGGCRAARASRGGVCTHSFRVSCFYDPGATPPLASSSSPRPRAVPAHTRPRELCLDDQAAPDPHSPPPGARRDRSAAGTSGITVLPGELRDRARVLHLGFRGVALDFPEVV